MGESGEVKQGHHQAGGETLQTLLGPPLTLQGLLVGQARLARNSTAPHKAVTQYGPLKEFTAKRTHMQNIISQTSFKVREKSQTY